MRYLKIAHLSINTVNCEFNFYCNTSLLPAFLLQPLALAENLPKYYSTAVGLVLGFVRKLDFFFPIFVPIRNLNVLIVCMRLRRKI